MTDRPLVTSDLRGGAAVVTLDSPHNRNALSRRLVAELTAAVHAGEAAEQARVVVLRHTGGTFCAGADLAEAMEFGMDEATRSLLELLRTVVALDKPVVAVVDGHVRAGGVGLVGACDLALVSDASTFAFSEARLGLAPAIISLTTRTRLSDREASARYLSGATFGGAEAARIGLVTRSVAAGDLDDAVAGLLADYAAVSPQGLRETKRLLAAPLLARIDAEGESLVGLSARLFASEEAREGMAAFREKRPPRWAN